MDHPLLKAKPTAMEGMAAGSLSIWFAVAFFQNGVNKKLDQFLFVLGAEIQLVRHPFGALHPTDCSCQQVVRGHAQNNSDLYKGFQTGNGSAIFYAADMRFAQMHQLRQLFLGQMFPPPEFFYPEAQSFVINHFHSDHQFNGTRVFPAAK